MDRCAGTGSGAGRGGGGDGLRRAGARPPAGPASARAARPRAMASSASSPQRDLPAPRARVGRHGGPPRRRRARRGQRRGVPGAAGGSVCRHRSAPARARRAGVRPLGRLPSARRGRARAVVSEDRRGSGRHRLRVDRNVRRAELPAARLVSCPGCYPTAAVLALAPLVERGPHRRRHRHRREVGRLRARARRRASGRTSPSVTAASRRTACSRTGTPPRSSRSWVSSVTFVPHLVPLDRGILETIYTRVRLGHDGGHALRRPIGPRTPARRSCG